MKASIVVIKYNEKNENKMQLLVQVGVCRGIQFLHNSNGIDDKDDMIIFLDINKEELIRATRNIINFLDFRKEDVDEVVEYLNEVAFDAEGEIKLTYSQTIKTDLF